MNMTSTYRATPFAMTLLAIAAAVLGPGMSQATSPPASWVNERVIECDGEMIQTYLTPGGFGTPFNVVGSNVVIIPKYVEVTVGGNTFVTIDVPGFNHDGPNVVACAYTDPSGLFVEFLGLRTSAPH